MDEKKIGTAIGKIPSAYWEPEPPMMIKPLKPRPVDYGKISDTVKGLQDAKKALDTEDLPKLVRKSLEKKLKNPVYIDGYSVRLEELEGTSYVSVKAPLPTEFDLETYNSIKDMAGKEGYGIDDSLEDRLGLTKGSGKVLLFEDRFLLSLESESAMAKKLAETVYKKDEPDYWPPRPPKWPPFRPLDELRDKWRWAKTGGDK